ncbi:hypothetical protein M9H77_28599 [Catharanthus roseus]|uniref:Uncharacterized protein n=1 Tax=Catharanthus roseus TaxID=4058 RepID=A0ACC0AJY1_CATRO|nr:hypothetical protein M9H77_28599 [Catharanthus roseus]
MEEVLAHVHPRPIVPDVLYRQHEHRSSLIWSGDHETCYTDLQYRHFGRNLFQCYSTAPLVHGGFGRCTTELGALLLVQIWAWSRIPAFRPQLMTEILANPLTPLGAIWLHIWLRTETS